MFWQVRLSLLTHRRHPVGAVPHAELIAIAAVVAVGIAAVCFRWPIISACFPPASWLVCLCVMVCPVLHTRCLPFSRLHTSFLLNPRSLQVIFVLPTAYPVTKENLNYAGVAVGVVLIFSLG